MSQINYKIFSVDKPQDYRIKYINEVLPTPIFRIVLIGHSGSGKSQFINNILFNQHWGYNKYFDEIYCFQGSLDDADELRKIASHYSQKNLSIQQVYDDTLVKDLFNQIERDNMNKKSKSRVLMTFDDQLCNNISSKSKLNSIDLIWTRGRHCAVNGVISAQKFKALNTNIRCLNATHLVVFSGTSAPDLESIAEEYNSKYTKDQIMEIFRTKLNQKYEFIIFDNANQKILDKNFEEINL
jgi:hypothetical protein